VPWREPTELSATLAELCARRPEKTLGVLRGQSPNFVVSISISHGSAQSYTANMPQCPVCIDAGDFTGSRGTSFGYTLKLAKLQEGKSRGCKKCTLFFDGFFAYASRWRRPPSLKKSVLIRAGNEQRWRDVQISVEESLLPELYLDYFGPPPKGE
jgi:hypothetical protein